MKNITLLSLLILISYSCFFSKTLNPAKRNIAFQSIETTDTSICIPNVFSPNGDGLNDIFSIKGNFTEIQVKIFNRFGEVIYKSILLNQGWDGRTTAGIECSEGTYFYIIKTNTQNYNGYLTLFR